MDALNRFTRTVVFGVLAFIGSAHAATPNAVDHTDLWWNAQESGWGLSLYQQEDVIFGTLFVYGPDGKGTWFAVGGLRPAASASGSPTWTSPLFSTRGPAFTNPEFDPAAVQVNRVGDLTVEFPSPYAGIVTYNVDSVKVVKQVTRQTWQRKVPGQRLQGGISAAVKTCVPGVPQGTLDMIGVWNVSYAGPAVQFSLPGGCSIGGDYQQQGRLGRMSNGSLDCPSSTGAAYQGAVTVEEMEMNSTGMSGRIRVVDPFCTYEGSIGGYYAQARLGQEDAFTSMFWNPLESGYGVGVHSQGQVAFMTIYTYGADGSPVFFVAPNLDLRVSGFPNVPTPPPTLYVTEGPYFALPFDPASVKVTEVGAVQMPPVLSDNRYGLVSKIQGTDFTDSLQRMNFATSSLAGTYLGGIDIGASARCGHPGYDGRLTVEQSGNRVHMALAFNAAPGGRCTFDAVARPDGTFMSLDDGTYACDASSGYLAHTGTFRASWINAKQYGFDGFYTTTDSSGCRSGYTIGGIRAAPR